MANPANLLSIHPTITCGAKYDIDHDFTCRIRNLPDAQAEFAYYKDVN